MTDNGPPKRSSSLSEAAAAARRRTSPKYAQLRGDQQLELNALADELQAARTAKAERITANTVIRVAIDVLLSRRGVLVGNTEEELRASFLDYLKQLEEQAGRAPD